MTAAPQLTTGTRLVSAHCSTQVIVVRPPGAPVEITCGPGPMAILGTTESRPLGPLPTGSVGTEAGKHYTDPASGLELLCTHAGAGPIAADGRELILKHVIPL